MLVFSFLGEISRALISPAIFWLQRNEGRNLLAMPKFMRSLFAELALLDQDEGADAFLHETLAFARHRGIARERVQRLARDAAHFLSVYVSNRMGPFDRFPWSVGVLLDDDERLRVAYARALVTAERNGWFGRAGTAEREKLDFVGLLSKEMWPLVVDVANTGAVARKLHQRVTLMIGTIINETSGSERLVKTARATEGTTIKLGGLAAAVRAAGVPYDTGPHLEPFMAAARAAENERQDAVREARELLRVSVRETAVRATEELTTLEDAISLERDDAAALATALTARRGAAEVRSRARQASRALAAQGDTAGAAAANAEANAAQPRRAVTAPAPAAGQQLATARLNNYLCYIEPLVEALTAALPQIYLEQPADPVAALAAFLESFVARPAPATRDVVACPLCVPGSFTFPEDPVRDVPAHLELHHLDASLARLAAALSEDPADVRRCLGLVRGFFYEPGEAAPTLLDGDDDIMLDFDNEPIARDDAYRAVSAVVASQLAFAGIKALALPATAARQAQLHDLLLPGGDNAVTHYTRYVRMHMGGLPVETPPTPAPELRLDPEAEVPTPPPSP